MGNSSSAARAVWQASSKGEARVLKELIRKLREDPTASRADLKVALEWRNRRGLTPLMIAAANGHSSVVKVLLKSGCDPYAGNPLDSGNTALHYAAVNDEVETCRVFFSRAVDHQCPNQKQFTPKDLAMFNRSWRTFLFFCSKSQLYQGALMYQSTANKKTHWRSRKAILMSTGDEGTLELVLFQGWSPETIILLPKSLPLRHLMAMSGSHSILLRGFKQSVTQKPKQFRRDYNVVKDISDLNFVFVSSEEYSSFANAIERAHIEITEGAGQVWAEANTLSPSYAGVVIGEAVPIPVRPRSNPIAISDQSPTTRRRRNSESRPRTIPGGPMEPVVATPISSSLPARAFELVDSLDSMSPPLAHTCRPSIATPISSRPSQSHRGDIFFPESNALDVERRVIRRNLAEASSSVSRSVGIGNQDDCGPLARGTSTPAIIAGTSAPGRRYLPRSANSEESTRRSLFGPPVTSMSSLDSGQSSLPRHSLDTHLLRSDLVRSCRLCSGNPREMVAVPCGHVDICSDCHDNRNGNPMDKCLTCGHPLTMLIKLRT